MVIGSLYVVFPGIPDSIGPLIVSIVTLIMGAACALYLGKHEN